MPDAPAAPAPAAPAAPAQSEGTAPDTSTPAAPAAPAWKPPPIKVYGQTREVDPDIYHRYAQQGAAFDHQRQEIAKREAAQAERERAWKERFKADPAAALREAEVDPDGWAAERLISEHQRKQETPEQKEAREAKEERDRLKKTLAEREQADQQAKVAAERDRRIKALDESWTPALEKLGIPVGPANWPFIAHMADDVGEADELLAAGRVTPEEHAAMTDPGLLAKLALESIRTKVSVSLANLRGEAFRAVVGDAVLDIAAEAWVQREEAKRAGAAAQGGAGAVSAGVQRPAPQGNGREREANGQFAPASPSRARSQFEEITGIRRG